MRCAAGGVHDASRDVYPQVKPCALRCVLVCHARALHLKADGEHVSMFLLKVNGEVAWHMPPDDEGRAVEGWVGQDRTYLYIAHSSDSFQKTSTASIAFLCSGLMLSIFIAGVRHILCAAPSRGLGRASRVSKVLCIGVLLSRHELLCRAFLLGLQSQAAVHALCRHFGTLCYTGPPFPRCT